MNIEKINGGVKASIAICNVLCLTLTHKEKELVSNQKKIQKRE